MRLDVWTVLCLGLLMGGVGRAVAEHEVTTCSSAPVAVGERGEMVFHLAPHIVQTADSLDMYITKGNESDTLRCQKTDKNSSIECNTTNGHFSSEGVVGHELTLVAPKVTRDLEGVYILRVYVNERWENDTSCNFTIIEHRGDEENLQEEEETSNGNDKDSSFVGPIVVSAVILAFIGVFMGVVVFRYIKRSMCQSKATQGHGQHSQDAAEEMTASIQTESDICTLPGEDFPLIQTNVSVHSETPTSQIVPTTSDDSMATAFQGGELRLLLIGRIGAGKSSSGNTILGRETFEVMHGQIGTTTCDRNQAFRHNILIKVTDTPGLCHTTLSEEEVEKELIKGLATVAPGPHAILLVLRSDKRLTTEEYTAYTNLKQFLGENMTEFMIVVFTNIGYLDETFDDTLDETLQDSPSEEKQILDDAHRRYIGFNNILPMSERVLQGDRLIELVAKMNGGRHYTKQ